MSDDTALAIAGTTSEELAQLQAQQESEFDQSDFATPILKIGQALTREVQDGNAEAGEFINTLTGEGLGNKVEFVTAYYQKGRFAAPKEGPLKGRAFVAFGDTIPDSWSDLVGDEFVGTRFDEYTDAEETFKEDVNAGKREWGSGPLVSTTHNYTGLAIVSPPEDRDEEPELQPVRLSLQRTQMPAVRKWNSLKKMSLRNKPFWAKTFVLTTYKKDFPSGPSYLVEPKVGRDTTAEEQQLAAELAIAVSAGRVAANEDGAQDTPVEPNARGGAAF